MTKKPFEKKKTVVNVFNVTINSENYVLNIMEEEQEKGKSSMPNSTRYTCMSFVDNEMMTPFKRFTIVYNRIERSYWAWTGDVTREEDRIFRESIADLLNNESLKITS